MTPKRKRELENDMTLFLTAEEVAEGWHFCMDWDGMLIHKDDAEFQCCVCPYKPKEKQDE